MAIVPIDRPLFQMMSIEDPPSDPDFSDEELTSEVEQSARTLVGKIAGDDEPGTPFLTEPRTPGGEQGDTEATDKSDFGNDFEPDEPKPYEPALRPEKKPRPPPQGSSSDATSIRDRAFALLPLRGFALEEFDELLESLYEERRDKAEAKQFHEGEQLNKVITHVQKSRSEQEKDDLQAEAQERHRQQKEEFQAELDRYDSVTSEMGRKLAQSYAKQRERLMQQQHAEIAKNCERWQSLPKQRQYNRASAALIIQRRQLSILLQQNRFADAEQVQLVVEKLEREEEAKAQKTMQYEYNESVKKLGERHAAEMQFLNTAESVKVSQLYQRRQITRMIYTNKEKKLEKRGEDASNREKVWAQAQAQRAAMNRSGQRPGTIASSAKVIKVQPPSTVIRLPPLQMNVPVRNQGEAQTAR
jgi:hypothetical protein